MLIALTMVASFTPTPLYSLYQEQWGISDVQVSLAFAAYPAGVISVLLFLGGISDRIGRRNTLLIGLAVLVLALFALALAPSYPVLVLGRLIHGFGSGLATSAAAAALMESHPRGLASGAFVNTACIGAGVAAGPLLSGALAEITPHPLLFPYLAIVLALLIPAVLLLRVPRPPRATGRVRIVQPIGVPRALWLRFSVAAAAIITANLCMGVYGSFGTRIAHTVGWDSQGRTGWLVSGMLFFLALAQFAGRRLEHTTSMSVGALGAASGWIAAACGAQTGSLPVLLIGSLMIGTGAGLCLLGSAGFIGSISPQNRRAEIYSAYLLVAFTTLGMTAVAAGPLNEHYSIELVLACAAAVTITTTAWILTLSGGTSRLRGRRFLSSKESAASVQSARNASNSAS